MTIGVDIRIFSKHTRSGVEEYTINLLDHLVRGNPNIHFKFFYNAARPYRSQLPIIEGQNVTIKEYRIPNKLFDALLKYGSWPKIDALLGGCDVFFSSHFLLTPLSARCRRVLTFHDLSFEHFPEFFSWSRRIWHAFMNPKKQAKEADGLIAVSQSTKADLVNMYGISPEKIKVIHSGIDRERFMSIEEGEFEVVKQKYSLPDKFVLYFGTIEPRKNIVGVIKAFTLFKERNRDLGNFKLVISGRRGWLYETIFKEAKLSPHGRDIIFTDFIPEEDKPYLYRLSSLFVYPSFFEGFGFPPLEAMAAGVPVITSNTSSFPEVVGDAALMIDPYDIDEMAYAMELLLTDASFKNHYIEKSKERVKQFSWEECAKQTLEILIGK